jgi:hypothetical protein
MVTVMQMTFPQFDALPDNPRQRDTLARLARAKHLNSLESPHQVVAAYRLPDGTMGKVDGHTRCEKWRRGELEIPPILTVLVFDVPRIEAAGDLYWMFDNPVQIKGTRDMVHGYLQELGREVERVWLRNLLFSALLIIEGNVPRYRQGELVKLGLVLWWDEIAMLDQCPVDLHSDYRISSLVAGALVAAEANTLPGFLREFNEGGHFEDGYGDGPYMLRREIDTMRLKRATAGHIAQERIAAATVKALTMYKTHDRVRRMTTMDWKTYIKRRRRIIGIRPEE